MRKMYASKYLDWFLEPPSFQHFSFYFPKPTIIFLAPYRMAIAKTKTKTKNNVGTKNIKQSVRVFSGSLFRFFV